jgi:hypothetical protein
MDSTRLGVEKKRFKRAALPALDDGNVTAHFPQPSELEFVGLAETSN